MNQDDASPAERFLAERRLRVEQYGSDAGLTSSSSRWLVDAFASKYMYNFDWAGRPIIQLPDDIVAVQEILWDVKPDLVIETGIAHGGSLMLSASILALLDLCDERAGIKRPAARRVLGIDIDIRLHNRRAIEEHPLSRSITMIEASSIDPRTIVAATEFCGDADKVVVLLDANHTRDHVFAELCGYGPLVSKGSYCIVFDTIVESLPADAFPGRGWEPGNSPEVAIDEFLNLVSGERVHDRFGQVVEFERDGWFNSKLLNSASRGGYLQRV